MNKRVFAAILLVVVLVALTMVPMVLAGDRDGPAGGCPDGFALHLVSTHDHQAHDQNTMHLHVGLDSNQNGDGYWCVKHVGGDQHVHVHVDNDRPLP
jgi:hypothetical protein